MDTAKIVQINDDGSALVEFHFQDGSSDTKNVMLPTTSQADVITALVQAAAGSKTTIAQQDAAQVMTFDPQSLIGQSQNITQALAALEGV